MADSPSTGQFVFPRWANLLLPALIVGGVVGGAYLATLIPLAAAYTTHNVGYMPKQPLAFSHDMHAGQLGIDCRYCHTTVEDAAFAAIPPTQTCWNCHGQQTLADGTTIGPAIRWDSAELDPVRQSHTTGMPIEWVKVHDLADYVYFNHASHVNAGVSCVECHGRIDRMEEVHQAEPLSMMWCLECHRDPDDRIRPVGQVTNLGWTPDLATEAEQREMQLLREGLPTRRQMTDCSTCHR
jgi:hypothetical protein